MTANRNNTSSAWIRYWVIATIFPHSRQNAIEEIILAIPSAKGKTVREIVAICRQTPAKLRIFQGTDDLLDRRHRLREIQLEDLLRREPVKMNLEEIALYLNDKTVLVSGAGGSIGSELCRQVCMHGIKK